MRIFMTCSTSKKAKKFPLKNQKGFSLISHIPPLDKAKEREMPLLILSPIPFRDGMGLRMRMEHVFA